VNLVRVRVRLRLVQAEWHKLTRNPAILIFGAVATLSYLFMTWSYYRWHSAPAWDRITDYPYSWGSMCIGLLMLLALPAVFTQEYQLQTDALILSSKYGKDKLIQSKIIAALLFVTIAVTGGWIINIGVNVAFAGWEGWESPIQTLPKHELAPYALVNWQYMLIQLATNWLGCIVFGLFILYLSVRSRTNLTIFFIAGLVLVMPFFIRNSSELSVTWLMKNLPMVDAMRVINLLNRPRFVRIDEWVLQLPFPMFITYLCLLAVLLMLGIYRAFRAREITA